MCRSRRGKTSRQGSELKKWRFNSFPIFCDCGFFLLLRQRELLKNEWSIFCSLHATRMIFFGIAKTLLRHYLCTWTSKVAPKNYMATDLSNSLAMRPSLQCLRFIVPLHSLIQHLLRAECLPVFGCCYGFGYRFEVAHKLLYLRSPATKAIVWTYNLLQQMPIAYLLLILKGIFL